MRLGSGVRNFARKIIDAIQHALLDQLLLRLIPLWWFGLLWDSRNQVGDRVTGLTLLAILVVFALAWALGALANRRPRQHARAGTFDHLHESGPNGFSAWSELPAEGLRPSWVVRRIVVVLSAWARSPIINLIVLGGGLLGVGLVVALAFKPDAFWAGLHPDLAEASARDPLWLIGAAALLLMQLRMWATDQRERLEPTAAPQPAASHWAYAVFAMFLLAGGAFAVMMGLPLWIVVASALGLCVIALVRRWRERALDWTFGKRSEYLPPPVVGPPQP